MLLTRRLATAGAALLVAVATFPALAAGQDRRGAQTVWAQASSQPPTILGGPTFSSPLPNRLVTATREQSRPTLLNPFVDRASLIDRPFPHALLVQSKQKRTGLTLMIVGGAAFVSGVLIGGSGGALIAVGGVGVGAYGLYLYVDSGGSAS